jgi:hypothetical protein
MPETLLSPSNVLLFGKIVEDLQVVQVMNNPTHSPFIIARTGGNGQLESQLAEDTKPFIARIYGFSYEGTYYDMPQPPLFLVHGLGEPVTLNSPPVEPVEGERTERTTNPARSPSDPSLSGVAAAEFQFSDGLRAWSYDKCDHTIRMDIEAGEFQDVLLSPFFGDGGSAVSRARVSGAHVSGAHLSGRRVSGTTLRGGGASD